MGEGYNAAGGEGYVYIGNGGAYPDDSHHPTLLREAADNFFVAGVVADIVHI